MRAETGNTYILPATIDLEIFCLLNCHNMNTTIFTSTFITLGFQLHAKHRIAHAIQ